MDRIDPAEPIERIEPAEPIDRMDPVEPMLKIDPARPFEAFLIRIRPFLQQASSIPVVAAHSRGHRRHVDGHGGVDGDQVSLRLDRRAPSW